MKIKFKRRPPPSLVDIWWLSAQVLNVDPRALWYYYGIMALWQKGINDPRALRDLQSAIHLKHSIAMHPTHNIIWILINLTQVQQKCSRLVKNYLQGSF